MGLKACKNCGRNFADDRIEKHEEICLKTAAKKRKVFDMTKARVKGTDAAKYVKSSTHLKNIEAKEQKKNDWRKKREEFINNLRAAKEVQRHLANGGSIKDLPPPPPATHRITYSVLTVDEDSLKGLRTDTFQNVKTSSPIRRDRISNFNQEHLLYNITLNIIILYGWLSKTNI